MPTHSTSWILISSHLCLGLARGLFPLGSPIKTLYTLIFYPNVLHAPPISFFWFNQWNSIGWTTTDHYNHVVFSTPLLPRPSKDQTWYKR
jgi:hypothetical protein